LLKDAANGARNKDTLSLNIACRDDTLTARKVKKTRVCGDQNHFISQTRPHMHMQVKLGNLHIHTLTHMHARTHAHTHTHTHTYTHAHTALSLPTLCCRRNERACSLHLRQVAISPYDMQPEQHHRQPLLHAKGCHCMRFAVWPHIRCSNKRRPTVSGVRDQTDSSAGRAHHGRSVRS
jgi:hypothetical protein